MNNRDGGVRCWKCRRVYYGASLPAWCFDCGIACDNTHYYWTDNTSDEAHEREDK